MKPILLPLSLCLIFSFATASGEEDIRPNVILIFADDLGPGMLSYNGQDIVHTPNIDRLAEEGISFDHYYGSVFCSPARWSLLTGMHDGRIGGYRQTRAGLSIRRDSGEITETEYEVQLAKLKASANPIAENEVFLAQVAQNAGYKTAQFGKLDRGFLTWHERVKRFGWDHYEGLYDHVRCHGFYPPYIWRNGERINLEGNPFPNCGKASENGLDEPVGKFGETYSQDIFLEGILNYLRKHAEAVETGETTKPFFLYHPTQLPHGPSAVPSIHPDYANDARLDLAEKKYATMVKMLDDDVGEIMSELKRLGMDENTVVLFTSDNGHELYYGPKSEYIEQKTSDGKEFDLLENKFRSKERGDVFSGAGDRAGLKRSGYQGGIQCPLFVRWPGKIPEGRKTNHLSAHYDFMATLADIIGSEIPNGKDSISYLPTLLGGDQVTTHEYLFIHNPIKRMGGSTVIKKDGWKLIEDNKSGVFHLYNIFQDNLEQRELSAVFPEIVENLKIILRREKQSRRPDLENDRNTTD